MSVFDPAKAFEAAQEKFAGAKAKLEAMKAAKTLDELSVLWEEFLAEYHRVLLRLRKATEQGNGKGWFNSILNSQRTDELLRYMLHARDAAEHGIEKITEKRPGGVAIRPKQGNSILVRRMEIRGDHSGAKITIDPETMEEIEITFHPDNVSLVTVVDRGTAYQPPTSHLGRAIADVSPVALAEIAIAYLEAKIAEAGQFFNRI